MQAQPLEDGAGITVAKTKADCISISLTLMKEEENASMTSLSFVYHDQIYISTLTRCTDAAAEDEEDAVAVAPIPPAPRWTLLALQPSTGAWSVSMQTGSFV